MKTEQITDYHTWQEFFNENGSPSFLQSWEWGEFEKECGYEILRLGIFASNRNVETRLIASLPIAIALIIKIKAKRGNFLFIPHGPIIQVKSQKLKVKSIIKELRNYLIAVANKEGFSFIRVAPVLEDTDDYRKIFSDLGFRKAPIYMHAERLWVLPLISENPSDIRGNPIPDEELLSRMRKTTRYLIRKAVRDGVVIEKRTDDKALDDFWKVYTETAEREKFVPFSKTFIRNEFELFHKTNNALFLFGKQNVSVIPDLIRNPDKIDFPKGTIARFRGNDNKISYLASALIVFTKSTAFYHQGASIHTKVPVTYALQWEAIKEAKKRGCKLYNFWGILQEKRTPKNWQGLTLFKTGFGGRQIDYLPTQDYVISPKYYLTYLYEKFLGWRRGV